MKSGLQLGVFLLLVTVFSLLEDVSADVEKPVARSCFFYTGANTTAATCNDIPNYICSSGCHGTFVTAQGCYLGGRDNPQSEPTTQVCDWGFGRDTAAAKACQTMHGFYSCNGTVTGEATCYDCHST